jgi:MFS family permease
MAELTLSRGLTNSFSIFETYYQYHFPDLSHSTISWIGSLQLFLTLFVGVPTGKYLDAGYIRPVVVAGVAFEVVGMVLTSFCKEFWQLVLAQGVCVGIGCGMLAFTSAAVIPFYFTKRRMLAAGTVSTGSSIGKSTRATLAPEMVLLTSYATAGVVYPLMMRELFDKVGFGWAVRTLSLVMLVTLSISLVLLKPHAKHTKDVPMFNMAFLCDTPYTLFILGRPLCLVLRDQN